MDAQKVLNKLEEEKAYTALSVRISRKAYDQLQEVAELTGHKPAQIMRACLEQGIGELLESLYWPQNEGKCQYPADDPRYNGQEPI